MTLCFLSHFNIIHATLRLGMWSSGTWSTQEVPNTRSQYLWWAGTILLFILNIIFMTMIIIIIILTFLVLIKIIILLLCQVGHSWRAEEQLFLWCGLRQGRDGEYTSDLIQTSVLYDNILQNIFCVKIQISANTWYNYYRSRDCKILIL